MRKGNKSMEIRKEIVEVVEREVKREYNLLAFATLEFSLRTKSVSVKLKDEVGTEVSVKVTMDKALEYYYLHLVEQGEVDESIVTPDAFIRLYQEGVAIEEMEYAVSVDFAVAE